MKSVNARSSWFSLLPSGSGMLAFLLHRLTGIGLVVYLYLHLIILSQLRNGPAGWDRFVALARSPLFLILDVLLLGGALFHGLNGIRLTLVGFGRGLGWQKQLFWSSLVLTALLTGLGAVAIFVAIK